MPFTGPRRPSKLYRVGSYSSMSVMSRGHFLSIALVSVGPSSSKPSSSSTRQSQSPQIPPHWGLLKECVGTCPLAPWTNLFIVGLLARLAFMLLKSRNCGLENCEFSTVNPSRGV